MSALYDWEEKARAFNFVPELYCTLLLHKFAAVYSYFACTETAVAKIARAFCAWS